jgi:KUP system potassium uptake protein
MTSPTEAPSHPAPAPGGEPLLPEAAHAGSEPPPFGRRLLSLALGALGIVYGDIGTSPLYALRECLVGTHPVPVSPTSVLGILSLIFWALIVLISIKYLTFVLRADNGGEGGILALLALAQPARSGHLFLLPLGLFGAALLYGDGVITPAISVLSAVEGLQVATHLFDPYVVPITIAVLIGLFLLQRRGTAGIGALFGPVMLLWFFVIAALGISWIVRVPSVLKAVDPLYAFRFLSADPKLGFLVLGSVFLAVTGGEALYADMGHFGKRPIRIAWFTLVLPALLANYFGQGALLLTDPSAAEHPFYRLAPTWGLLPLVALSTVATVIASQAVISGAFSLTRQAVQLGYCPRVAIVHTSKREIGQIYIPSVNWLLMIATIGLVLGFRRSTHLAAAYGIAVTTTMVITTLLAYYVARERWGWGKTTSGLIMGCFLIVDLSFWSANIVKIPHGGWFPLLVGALLYVLMSTWKEGRRFLAERLEEGTLPIAEFVGNLTSDALRRVPGTAVFLTTNELGTPPTLLHNLKHNKVLHEKIVLMTVVTESVPTVPRSRRVDLQAMGKGFYRLKVSYGFTQDPDARDALESTRRAGLDLDLMKTSFFLSRSTLLADGPAPMARWRKRLFAEMSSHAERFTDFFRLPPNRVIELGMQVNL